MCYVGSPFRGALGLWKGRFDGEEAAVIQHVLTPARTDALISVQVFRWGQDPSASTVLSFQTFTPDPRKSSGALISTSFADAEDSSAESELSLQPTHRESCCPWTAKFPNAPVMSEMCRRAGKHRVGNIKIDKKIKEAETHREEKRGWTRLISAQTSSVHDYRDVCNYVSVNNETETPVSQALKIDPEHLTWLQHIRTLWMFWMFRMIWDHFGS